MAELSMRERMTPLAHRNVFTQPSFDRKDSVGVGRGFLREQREYTGIGREAVGPVQERLAQL